MNWPNRVTVFRIILVPVFVLAVYYQHFNLALGVFVLASISDALDGYLARTRNEKTKLGAVLDPIADKMLIISAFVSLSVITTGVPYHLQMPGYVPIIIISRDVLILTGVAVIYLVSGRIDIRPTNLSKATTFFQMLTIVLVLIRFDHSKWIWNAAVILTLLSGFDYVRIASRSFNGKR